MSEEIEDLASRIREVRSGARRGNTIVELMEIAGFEPVSAFRGGDWRGCDFSTCDLRGFDLRDARFFQANFEKARVEEADFRGANLHQTTLHLASDWRRAILSPEQRRAVMLHADRCGYALTARDREELGTANGSGVSIRQYNERIRDAESYKEALEIFDDLAKAGVAPDKYTFTLLIGAAPSEGLAKGHFQDMLDHQVAPDRVALNALMDRMGDRASAEGVISRFAEFGHQPDIISFNILLKRCQTLEEARALVAAPPFAVSPDQISFNILVSFSVDFDSAVQLLEEMQERGFAIRDFDVNAVLDKARTRAEIIQGQVLIEQFNIPPNDVTFNILIKKVETWNQALDILDAMRRSGVRPDKYTYNTLILVSDNMDDSFRILRWMAEDGVPCDGDTTTSFGRSHPQARRILAEVESNGGTPANALIAVVERFAPLSDRAALRNAIRGR